MWTLYEPISVFLEQVKFTVASFQEKEIFKERTVTWETIATPGQPVPRISVKWSIQAPLNPLHKPYWSEIPEIDTDIESWVR